MRAFRLDTTTAHFGDGVEMPLRSRSGAIFESDVMVCASYRCEILQKGFYESKTFDRDVSGSSACSGLCRAEHEWTAFAFADGS